jgi:hypothetical protein
MSQDEAQGVKDGEAADLQNENENESSLHDENGVEKDGAEIIEQSEKKGKDSAFAELRRRAEAAERQLRERDAWVSQKYGESYGIHTWEQYQAAIERNQRKQAEDYRQKRETELEQSGYNVKEIREIMRTDPEYQALKAENEQLRADMEKDKKAKAQEKGFQKLNAEHAALRKKFGDLVPPLDKIDGETARLIMEEGWTLTAAWKEANEDKILEWAKTRERSKTLRDVNSKDHLGSEKSSESQDLNKHIEITPEIRRTWQRIHGKKITDAEIRKRIAKYQPKTAK